MSLAGKPHRDRMDHIAIDLMHCGDLGTFQDAVGSLFWIDTVANTALLR
jgi:hypothetical protein